ncbi:MAG: hypothetical protein WDM90_06770 [Ferruginibacter sp.]
MWAGEGFEIASNQFQLQKATVNAIAPAVTKPMVVTDTKTNVSIKGENFTVGFSKVAKGGLNSYIYNDKHK